MKDSLPVIKGLIFDLDGTLLNSLEDLREACNHTLALHGLPLRNQEEIRLLIGGGVRGLLRQAAPNESSLDIMVRQMLEFYSANCCVKTFPYPGAQAMLEKLAGQGVPVAVLSNKMQDLTLRTVEYYFPCLPFAAIEGSREGRALKPDPAVALEIAARLGLAPPDLGFVGDTGTDMGTAVNSGMWPIGVTWGFRSAAELLSSGAKTLLDRPEELFSKIRFAVS